MNLQDEIRKQEVLSDEQTEQRQRFMEKFLKGVPQRNRNELLHGNWVEDNNTNTPHHKRVW